MSKDGFSQSKELYNNWRTNMAGRALQMGTDSESKSGFYCTYFLVREPWPEMVVSDLLARIDALESEIDALESEVRGRPL